jgi:hypothetical protein
MDKFRLKRKPGGSGSGSSSSSAGYPHKSAPNGSASMPHQSPQQTASGDSRTPNAAALLSQLDHLDSLMAAQHGEGTPGMSVRKNNGSPGKGNHSAASYTKNNNGARSPAMSRGSANRKTKVSEGDMDQIVNAVSNKLSISSSAGSSKASGRGSAATQSSQSLADVSPKFQEYVRPVFSNSSDDVELEAPQLYAQKRRAADGDDDDGSSFGDDETEYFDSRGGVASYTDEEEYEVNHRQQGRVGAKSVATGVALQSNAREQNNGTIRKASMKGGSNYASAQQHHDGSSDEHSSEGEYVSTEEDASSIEEESASSDGEDCRGGRAKALKTPQHVPEVQQVITEKSEDEASDSAEDYSDDEDEGEDGYKPGGYHTVKVGEIYNQR